MSDEHAMTDRQSRDDWDAVVAALVPHRGAPPTALWSEQVVLR